MIQHLLLMMIAPPLLLLANPFLPLLIGLPRPIVREWIRPFLLWTVCKTIGAMVDPSEGHMDPFCGHDFGLACSSAL